MSESFGNIEAILDRFPPQPEHLISALQDVQAKFNYISPAAMRAVCDHLGVPISRGWAVATFYKSFSLVPRGVHDIRVCLGTACHLKGGARLVEGLERELDVPREHTTKDMRFTLETVRCLGTCAMAPVVMIDEEYLAEANIRSLKRELKKI
ncbi:MAG TPA: NAD(P)H-dependent oxidoreductase subunit E [Desulfobaccales bacterium]|jgi:NADH-quinone oxidoreductase subunit E